VSQCCQRYHPAVVDGKPEVVAMSRSDGITASPTGITEPAFANTTDIQQHHLYHE